MKHEHPDETPDPRESPRDRAIDDALGQALRAEDPGAAFTQRVLARAREERAAQQSGRPLHAIGTSTSATATATASASASSSPSSSSSSSLSTTPTRSEVSGSAALDATPSRHESGTPRVRVMRSTRTRKLIAAIAASLTLAAAGAQWVQHRRYVAEGERARAQVLAALRLTNEKLNFVHDKITERDRAR